MGCGSSRDRVCPNCHSIYSPAAVRRNHSLHRRRLNRKTGEHSDSDHVVELTSSTLGSLNLVPESGDEHWVENGEEISTKTEFEIGLVDAKTWSKMIEEKIPKVLRRTPPSTPPGDAETINAWELMEGLEDISPLRPPRRFHSLSFSLPINSTISVSGDREIDSPIVAENDSNSNSYESEFDPEVIAAFRRAMEDLPPPPGSPYRLIPSTAEKPPSFSPPTKEKVTVYFTSLRGVRKTYEDCCQVLAILKSMKVRVDERDVSMHSGFREELRDLPGEGLPRVFAGKKHIGGGEEIRRMNEEGKLREALERCERDDDDDDAGNWCEVCGNIRFIPCRTCSGSCKIMYDDKEMDDHGFHRCPDCNENGLLRCPMCCDL